MKNNKYINLITFFAYFTIVVDAANMYLGRYYSSHCW